MKLPIVIAGLLLCAAPLSAETYSWVDEKGTYNFTEEYSHIPKKYRNRVDRRADPGAPPVSNIAAPPAGGTEAASPAAKAKAAGKPGPAVEKIGGKSYDQWTQEFRERETAMLAIRKRLDEIDVMLKNKPETREQTQVLIAERNAAVVQFIEIRKQYDQLAEQARKSGILVEVTQ